MSREILLWEYLSGGGMARNPLPASLLCEGIAMLRAIARDFAGAGFHLTIALDHRLLSLRECLPPSSLIPITPDEEIRDFLIEQATQVGAFFLIVPEFDNLLFSYTQMLEKVAKNWGCPSEFIKIFGNKWETWKFWESRGINTPQTRELSPGNAESELLEMLQERNDKIVIKPASGAGAEKTFTCSFTDMQKPRYASMVMNYIRGGGFIAQRFIPGIPCSVNFIAVHKKIHPMCVNDQLVELYTSPNSPSQYLGGISPSQSLLKHHTPEVIENTLQSVIDSISPLESGIFGLDFICDGNGSFHFIEINSRLTTSYVALSQVLSQNPVSVMMQGKPPPLGKILRKSNQICFYRKLNLRAGNSLLPNECKHPLLFDAKVLPRVNFACPPLQDSLGNVACFVSIAGSTCDIIAQEFKTVQQQLLHQFTKRNSLG